MVISIGKFLHDSQIRNKDSVIFTSSEEEAQYYASYLRFFYPNVLYLPSFDTLPYDRVSPSNRIISERSFVLSNILWRNDNKKIIVTSAINLLSKFSIKTRWSKPLLIEENQKISKIGIEKYLLENGYNKSVSAVDSREFSSRGDIIDIIANTGLGYRVIIEWDKVEKIKIFDPESQISTGEVKEFQIFPASEIKFDEQDIENFKALYLKSFGLNKIREAFYEKISSSIRPAGIESVSGAFYQDSSNIVELIENPNIYATQFCKESIREFYDQINDFYEARKSSDSFYPAFKPDILYNAEEASIEIISKAEEVGIIQDDNFKFTPNFFSISQLDGFKNNPLDLYLDYIKSFPNKYILLTCSSLSAFERLKSLLIERKFEINSINNFSEAKKFVVNIVNLEIAKGFESKELIFTSDKEIFGEKKIQKTSSVKKIKNIFRELENFAEGDLVVHVDHGIGRYDGIENLAIGDIRHDCLKIIYARGDKLFIPVENIGYIKKFGEGEAELDYLGSVSWQKRKAKLKERIGELANSLIATAAKREVIKITPIEFDPEAYEKFCSKFPYVETEDQSRVINEIYEDLISDKAMDRVVCGDVGFGKTEVAMRAAFLAALNKQVVVIVPTTILARQHYNNFLERFSGFGYKIAQLSRFVSSSEIKKVKDGLKNGEIDIVIGTHAILSNDVSFKDLGLVIIDEEQHFGVVQKEKLKKLKENVHYLTLTATPIPRTLQMSLIGIKSLSIIATAPVDRLAVKTSLIPYDEVIIKEAILREKFRGGKSFFVCPRVSDLNELFIRLTVLLPEVRIKVAHGQLSPKTIDEIMTEFYEGKFDVLLSTAIVESGLDIPSANTIFIYKAEMFGLSQLYQLRGRVGRAKSRGFAYLVTDRKKLPTKSAIKRLEILQSIDSLGAGFSIATHDMDNRGFGNLVGDEQSGHIKEVGIELYQDMLEEAILATKNDVSILEKTNSLPEVKMNLPIFIPESYIENDSLRLSIYRRAGDIRQSDELEEFRDELIDRFGAIPDSVQNLLDVILLKILCKNIGINSLEVGKSAISMCFNENVNGVKIIDFASKNPSKVKIRPDNKLIYSGNYLGVDIAKNVSQVLDNIGANL